jgi:large conductance mechanosensitive channel
MKILSEFKEFALKGNMVDLAVGVIIGAAFGAIVKSLVDDVMMPPLGWLMGGLDFSDKVIVLQHAQTAHPITGKVLQKDVVLSYGKFINASIQFLIVAIAIFAIIKAINAARRKPESAAEAPAAPPEDVKLLTEIRDLLAAQKGSATPPRV